MKKEDYDKKVAAFILRLENAKDAPPDTLKAEFEAFQKDAASYHTAEKYDGIDTLLAAKGLKKPEGVKTLDFIQTVAQSANEAATLKTEIETLKADKGKAPDVAKLKSEFEGTINTLKDQLAQKDAEHLKELRTISIKSKVDAIQFAESFKSAESYVKAALTAKLSGFEFENVDGKQYIKNGNTFLVDNGKMVSLEDFISKETATFVKTEKQTTPPPASPKGGTGTGQTVTDDQKAAFVQANNINILSAEGQAALAAAFPDAK
jgi:hypothetical protein